ncbi:hypothetical protein M011DRAFT_471256 [Sporormia fimetaria CBS 119925]|uniref:Uncharacterized protein n=1 Tax=Sporormia fimetaria CBS 119925 TaxID=1340428 RepID=A0A6A6UZL2_9PLEO|nr:hypothetical protein M011DRAFT_471256 [Sporormia fimetaria CBS 119925]
MPFLQLRELVQYPAGDNVSHTVVNGVHFNLTALQEYHYAVYSNNTISNDTKCYLIFDNFKPHMFSNGSWINATTCYVPYYSIGARGTASAIVGSLFGLSIIFTLLNLRKHGKLYVREDKRFRVVGRRWQWYWMCFVAACAMISTFTGLDVDRYYLQQIPIILQSFFFILMVPGALAMVWECVRHWGSWQERQIVDREPFSLRQDDRRSKTEFWLPLVFYLFAWMNFFMTIPRSWTPLQKQNTPWQKEHVARPAATGNREKAGAVLAVMAYFVICFSLYHSLKCYKPRVVGIRTVSAFVRDCPVKIIVSLILLAIRLGYGLASAWLWDLSIFQDGVNIVWPFGLGYAPVLLIIIVFEIAGFLEENEDKRIIEQRRALGQMHDQELGIVHKPHWWSRNWVARYQTNEQRLKEMTREGAGGRSNRLPGRSVTTHIELGDMSVRNRSRSRPPEDPFRDQSPSSSDLYSRGLDAAHSGAGSDTASARTVETQLTGQNLDVDNISSVPQQRVRSMLDI